MEKPVSSQGNPVQNILNVDTKTKRLRNEN
jgi:hypothetical protein